MSRLRRDSLASSSSENAKNVMIMICKGCLDNQQTEGRPTNDFTCHSTIPVQLAARMYQVRQAETGSCAPAQRSCKQSLAVLLFRDQRKNFLLVASHRESIEQNSGPVLRNHTPRLRYPKLA